MGEIMDVQKLTIYQKTVVFHFSYIESKLFRNRFILVFLSSLILALTASSGMQWYSSDALPNINTCAVLVASLIVVWYLTTLNKHLSTASIYLIEYHTRLHMIMKMLNELEKSDIDYKSILESEMELVEKEFNTRFRHTVR